ncbi:REP-associated tyrosine transposase [Arhodomonas sp. AD133]|uniref:REP-associated tyrosine transposase n=1 Tax=Arhodomonas sp. AD133 TaxID=3415009 RepID=UPI003EBC685D
MEYRRARMPGASYFFTVVTSNRQPLFRNERLRRLLGDAMRVTARHRPFRTDAIVLLPDHLHCIWTLPPGDADFSERWRLIKRRVSARTAGQRIWQPRFWEHLIRDHDDLRNHLEYIHYNPVKHGYVIAPRDWPWSSFHRYVRTGIHPPDWGESPPAIPESIGRE